MTRRITTPQFPHGALFNSIPGVLTTSEMAISVGLVEAIDIDERTLALIDAVGWAVSGTVLDIMAHYDKRNRS
jgi:hypothetical protein